VAVERTDRRDACEQAAVVESTRWNVGRKTKAKGVQRMSSPAKIHSLNTGTGNFPDFEETEHETSTIRVAITRGGKVVENLVLKALLRIERGRPATVLGKRQFEFQISEWDVLGRSESFGNYVSFKLANTPQSKSLCRAESADSDYPALIMYNALYDVYVGDKRVFENVPGLGVGGNVTEIPPRGIPIAFEKPFEYGDLCVQAGMCTEMASLTREEFEAQLREFQALRSGRISEPTTFTWPV
jgi:hypothetical protein